MYVVDCGCVKVPVKRFYNLIKNINIADSSAMLLRMLFKTMKREQTAEQQPLVN
jgi:hypothetical protein